MHQVPQELTLRSRFSESSKHLLRDLGCDGIPTRNRGSPLWSFIFYLVFYSVLILYSLGLWWLFYQTIDLRIPSHQTKGSLIGTNPGLGFRPMPANDTNVLSSLITYQGTNKSNFEYWTRSLADFLRIYKQPGSTPGSGQNIHNCDYDHPPAQGQVCDVDVKVLGPCVEENNFNYHLSAPCIILKLNKIYGWKPEFYNNSRELPADMPENLKQTFRGLEVTNSTRLQTIWVSCKGETPADAEHIGPIHYHPMPGFPGYYFPYENSEGYKSPIVAVQFSKPRHPLNFKDGKEGPYLVFGKN